MEKDEASTKLSGREARKQKLMEYLARKGRQKAPDPKSYLLDSTNSKKLTDTFVKPPTSIRGKENQSDPPGPKPAVTSARPAGGIGRTSLQASGSSYTASSTRMCTTTRCPRHSAANQFASRPHTDMAQQPVARLRTAQQPVARPDTARQPVARPDTARQPVARPDTARQPVARPSTARQPVARPSTARQPVARPSTARQPVTRPDTARQPVARPSTARQPVARPDTARQPVARPDTARQPVARPSTAPLDRRSQNTAVGQPNTRVMARLRASHAALVTSGPRKATSAPDRTPAVRDSKLSEPDLSLARTTGQLNLALGVTRSRPFNGRKASLKPALPRVRQPAESGPGARPGSRARTTPLAGERQSGPAEPRSGASALHRVVQQAVAGLDRKVSWRVAPPHVDGARNGTLAASRADGVPVTATPWQGQRKLTTAQEERLQKLQKWREAKGISYKRPPMPMKPCSKKEVAPPCYWPTMEKEDEVHRLVSSIDSSLTDCMQLLEEGCPTERVTELLSRLPMAQKFAKYWMCRARILEREGNLEVLPLFEEAVHVVLEPVDELRTMIYEILKKKKEVQEGETGEQTDLQVEAQEISGAIPVTPQATSVLIRGAKEGSSVVKYKITATPGAQKCQQQEPMRLDGQELRFFTPVRRSVRIERSARRYPSALRERDPCVASFRDLLAEELPEGREFLYIYRENEALGDQVQLQFRSPEAL